MSKNKIKVSFLMYQVITGGIEKCLLTIIKNLSVYDKYEFTVITKKEVTSKYFLDFFKKYNVQLLTLPNIESIGEKPHSLLKKIKWKIKRKKIKNKIKKILNNKLPESDLIIDYFNMSFWDLILDINKPKITFWHASTMMFEKYYTKEIDKIMISYSKFVCLTEETKNNLINKYPNYKEKFIHIYNPFNIEDIKKLAEVGKYPKDSNKYFTFLGRFHEDKDHLTVIKAVELVVKKIPDLKVYFIGEGSRFKEYQKLVNEKNLENNIIFAGVLDNPYGYLKHATANILSSPSEGLSTVLIESQILNTLNISSDTPSCAREILLNGDGGLLYPIGDYLKLAELMEKVWNYDIDKELLINNATNSISRFESQKIIHELDKLFEELKEKSNVYEK